MRRLIALIAGGLLSASALAMEAPKIAEIKAASGQESLWQFLERLPASFEAQILYGLILSGVFGIIASWLWKLRNGDANGFHHFTLRYLVGQVIWIVGVSLGSLMTLGFTNTDGTFIGWLYVMWTGALAGFGGEIKTTQREWTPAEREARLADKPAGT